jgi:hypothetical protein
MLIRSHYAACFDVERHLILISQSSYLVVVDSSYKQNLQEIKFRRNAVVRCDNAPDLR